MISQVENIITGYDFSQWNLIELKKPLSIDIYKNWLNKDQYGSMEYLNSHTETKENPQRLLPKAQSAIVVTQNYYPHPEPNPTSFPLKTLRIASYAQGQDYHHWFKNKLLQAAEELKKQFPDHEFIAMTDSSPVLERDLAYQAGLGWFGKNSCLIHSQEGSLFFIGEIYSTLALKTAVALHPDRCGTCTRCIEACPTQALHQDRTMNAAKCISYLNIESKQAPPHELRTQMSDWFFGCDICQQVCPWNEKNLKLPPASQQLNYDKNIESLALELQWILQSSNKELLRSLRGSPLTRAGGVGLKRNAMTVIGNLKIKKLLPSVQPYMEHEKLSELAQWTLQQLTE